MERKASERKASSESKISGDMLRKDSIIEDKPNFVHHQRSQTNKLRSQSF